MRIYFDTEFIEDGKTIDLISIGMVREDGEEYYAISSEFDESKASDWVKENVIAKLEDDVERKTRSQIADEILEFVGPHPEFWAYFADYDWVVMCQLYGTMMDLPKGWPMFCMDLQQVLAQAGYPNVPRLTEEEAHNALVDAKWVKDTLALLIEK